MRQRPPRSTLRTIAQFVPFTTALTWDSYRHLSASRKALGRAVRSAADWRTMLRRSLLLALIVCLVAAAPGAGADQTRVKSYCSASGDVCYGIFKTGSVYSFRLTLAAKYFSRYRVCVRPMGKARTCKSFRVKRTGLGGQWGSNVYWSRNFPNVPGRYRVTWLQGTSRIGPPLNFTLPPTG